MHIHLFQGIISNFLAENFGLGPVAPFLAAVVPLLVCGYLVVSTWQENYGDRSSHLGQSCLEGLRIIFGDSKVLLLGIVQVECSILVSFEMYGLFLVFDRVLHVHICLPLDPCLGFWCHSFGNSFLLLHGLHHGWVLPVLHPLQSWLYRGQYSKEKSGSAIGSIVSLLLQYTVSLHCVMTCTV